MVKTNSRWAEWARRLAHGRQRFGVSAAEPGTLALRGPRHEAASQHWHIQWQPVSVHASFVVPPASPPHSVNFFLTQSPARRTHEIHKMREGGKPILFSAQRVVHSVENLERTNTVKVASLSEPIVSLTRRVEQRTFTQSTEVMRREVRKHESVIPAPAATVTSASLVAAEAAWSKPAIPPLNIDAISDQVARRLDQRMTAWRERTGRL
jgi:hypothetical protein